MNTIKIKIDNCNTKIIAHRGYAYCNLENTIDAFKFACSTSAYGVECDIQPSLMGELFVYHDFSLKRLTNKSGYFRLMPPSAIRNAKLISNNKEYDIPSFSDYLVTVSNKIKVIELKGWFDIFSLKRMLKLIKTQSNLCDCIFISFNLLNLKRLRTLEPLAQMQFLCERFNDNVLNTLIKYKFDLNINFQNVNRKVIKTCHKNKIKVNVWTVDDKQKLLDLINLGVDYVTTNKFEIV